MTQTQTKTYSITEMARTCGVSVSSMRSQLLKRGLKPAQTGENNSKLYDAAVLDTMKKYYRSKSKSSSNRQPQTTRSELIASKDAQIEQLQSEIELLKSQLDVKDEQIKSMTEVAKANAQLTAQAHTLDASHRLEDSTTSDTKPTRDAHGRLWHLFHD